MHARSLLTILLLAIILSPFSATCQGTESIPGDTQRQLRQQTDAAVEAKRTELLARKVDPAEIEFSLDTFRVGTWTAKCKGYIEKTQGSLSTMDMVSMANDQARAYDSLMNKYYRKLSAVLSGEDRKVLIQAQRAWMAFRDSESKLQIAVDYAGSNGQPGTMYSIIELDAIRSMIVQRTIEIYQYYSQLVIHL